ncbi:MAG: flagellar basal body rod protein FlgC, partial [Hypericibacter sp.]
MTQFFGVFEVSASGMDAERLRLQTATMNIVNASSVRSPDGSLYQPMRVITQPASGSDFSAFVDGIHSSGAVVAEAVPAGSNVRQVYDPDHPYA